MSGFPRAPVVFLVDVDNTLLDNDLVSADLLRHLDLAMGPEGRARYWALFEQLGAGLGYVDYLCALQRYRLEHPRHAPPDRVRLPGGLPVREPGLSGIARRRGVPAPQGGALRSGLLVDDKLRVLTVVKRSWGARVTTVFPRQGHYAHDPEALATNPAADLTVERLGDLVDHDLSTARARAAAAAS